MFNKTLFKSERLDWQTPKAVYQVLDAEFGFDFDPCPHNPSFNGLESDWGRINFVNPPYGREISDWIKKGITEYLKGKTIVFLVASRTDTVWWHDLMRYASEIRFIKGRLKFEEHDNSAPFPSAIVILKGNVKGDEDQKNCDTSCKDDLSSFMKNNSSFLRKLHALLSHRFGTSTIRRRDYRLFMSQKFRFDSTSSMKILDSMVMSGLARKGNRGIILW